MDIFQVLIIAAFVLFFAVGTFMAVTIQMKIRRDYDKHLENTIEQDGFVYPMDYTPIYGYDDIKAYLDDLIFKSFRHRYNMATGIIGDYRLIKFEKDLAEIADDVIHAIPVPMWMNICYSLNQKYVINYVLWTTEELIIKYGKEGFVGI